MNKPDRSAIKKAIAEMEENGILGEFMAIANASENSVLAVHYYDKNAVFGTTPEGNLIYASLCGRYFGCYPGSIDTVRCPECLDRLAEREIQRMGQEDG